MAFRGYYCCVCCDLGCSLVIAEQLFAFAAGPVLGVSGLCAGSSFRFGLLKGMTFCGYYCIFYCDFCCSFVIAEQLFAFAAGPVFGISILCAGCIFRVRLLKRMTLRSYYCLCFCDLCCSFVIAEQFLALAAGPVFSIASLCAGCIFRIRLLEGMALRSHYCIFCCDLGCSLVIAEQLFAFAAGPVFGITGIGARCGLCVRLLEGMALRSHYCIFCCDLGCSLVIAEQLFAFSAGPVFSIASLGTGCSFRFCLLKRMTLCGYYCCVCRDLGCSLVAE